MTKNEIETIKTQWDADIKYIDKLPYSDYEISALRTIHKLLDALDEQNAGADAIKQLTADRDSWKSIAMATKSISDLRDTDADYWKARAEMLEKVLRLTSGCNSCYHANAPGVTRISFVGQEVCLKCRDEKGIPNNYQFDQSRFSDKPTPC